MPFSFLMWSCLKNDGHHRKDGHHGITAGKLHHIVGSGAPVRAKAPMPWEQAERRAGQDAQDGQEWSWACMSQGA